MAMLQKNDPRGGFRIPKIKIEEDKGGLVGQAGLQAILRIFDSTKLGTRPPNGGVTNT